MAYEKEKEVAIAAVTAATAICQQVRREITPEAIEKKDKSPVTVADFGAQAVVCKVLNELFPNDPVVGEESATELATPALADQLKKVTQYVQTVLPEASSQDVIDWINHGNGEVSSRYWTVDPIDGTKGFLRGDQYAVALALVEDGDIKVGVLGCPALAIDGYNGVLLVAVRGEGATMMALDGTNPKTITVTTAPDSGNFRFVESVEHGDKELHASIAEAVGIQSDSVRMDSQAKYGAVASGEAVLYLRLPSAKYPNYKEKIWDHAAGVVITEEAGGRVTDMHGRTLDFSKAARLSDNRGVVVSNGVIHDQVLKALQSA
ncbi:MAG: 3'(2'),5'-bisphosphate nucleotidase [Cyanobacteria bacterium P01_A01_bin.105]